MGKSIYIRLGRLIIPFWPVLLLSTFSAVVYVIFNSLSIWLTASLINNILTDFDQLIKEHTKSAQSINSLNDQLKYWTNELILRETPKETLKTLCLTILIVFIVKNIFLYIKNLALTFVQFNLITQIRNNLFDHFHKLSISFFDKNRSGELTSILVNDVSNMRIALGTSFHKVFIEPINIISFILILFIINIKLATIAVFIIPITSFIILLIGRSIRRKSKRTAEQIAGIMGRITEILNSIRVVKAFGNEDYESRRFKKEQSKYYSLITRRAKLKLTASPITETIGAIIGVLLLWIGGLDVLVLKTMNSEDFIRFILIMFSVLGPIRLLSNVSLQLQMGIASAERVFKVLDTKAEVPEKRDPIKIDTFRKSIEFKNVGFFYGNNDSVLKDVSFIIEKGKMVAIVGPSGAGKSTIADLISRFYDVKSGSILLDGNDLRDISVQTLRNNMGIVTQETILFDETIEFNIAYGKIHYSEDELVEAAKAANAYNFINDQPNGFHTIIGEKGLKLSGGQRQRIAIARAILRNPPILILDEATSSLDTNSEREVQMAIDNLMRKRTTVVIAHRLSTIKQSDLIIVLEDGKVVEHGNHTSLIKNNGLYCQLYNDKKPETS
ncbi:MAG: ABC transporter ATP-binding protein [Candidatus Neomarinimicrobiota bacterium]